MSMLKFIFKIEISCGILAICACLTIPHELVFAKSSTIENEESTPEKSTSTSKTQDQVNSEYDKLTQNIRKTENQNRAIELIASGSAATLVGVYGYYFDERGSFAKLAYFATQTAGIFVLGEGIKKYHSRNLILDVHENNAPSSKDSFRRIVVENNFHNRYAKHRADAWSAGLLGSLYAYNAYRAKNDITNVRSVYIFLAANALAVCGYNTYQIMTFNNAPQLQTQIGINGMQVTWTLR